MTIESTQRMLTVVSESTPAGGPAGDPLAGDQGRASASPATAGLVPVSGASDAPSPVTAGRITDALRDVLDPELGMSVVDLGLIYGIEVHDGAVAVTMTLTAPGCPIHDAMADWVRQAAMRVPGVSAVEVIITFDPPWTPERIQLPTGRRA